MLKADPDYVSGFGRYFDTGDACQLSTICLPSASQLQLQLSLVEQMHINVS